MVLNNDYFSFISVKLLFNNIYIKYFINLFIVYDLLQGD